MKTLSEVINLSGLGTWFGDVLHEIIHDLVEMCRRIMSSK